MERAGVENRCGNVRFSGRRSKGRRSFVFLEAVL